MTKGRFQRLYLIGLFISAVMISGYQQSSILTGGFAESEQVDSMNASIGKISDKGTSDVSMDKGTTEISAYFFNVGKADAMLIRINEKTYMIDTGKKSSAKRLINAFLQLGVDHLDGVFLTHTHPDHIGGMKVLAHNFIIEQIYSAEISMDKKNGRNKIEELAQELGVVHTKLVAGSHVWVKDGICFDILGPLVYNSENDNDNSLVLRLSVNSQVFLFAGEMQFSEETTLLSAGIDVSATILKVGNHGNPDATSNTFGAAVSPEIAIISTDTSEDPNSANPQVKAALNDAAIYITEDYSIGISLEILPDGTVNINAI